MSRYTTSLVVLTLSLASGCVEHLPPANTPDRVVPPGATATAVPQGQGRLVVDVVDGPTRIQRVTMEPHPVNNGAALQTWWFGESYTPLCETSPCVVDLAPGNVLLAFPVVGDSNAFEVDLVHISEEPTVYRRALSYSEGGGGAFVLGIVGVSFGGMSAVTGAALLPIGLAKDKDGMTIAGGITLGVGTVLVGLSTLAILADPPRHRAGASAHYPAAQTTTP